MIRKSETARLTVSVEEAAEFIGLGRMATYEAVRRGQIPSIRLGKRILIPKAGLLKLLQQPEPETPAA